MLGGFLLLQRTLGYGSTHKWTKESSSKFSFSKENSRISFGFENQI
jgi:hypothetical protein